MAKALVFEEFNNLTAFANALKRPANSVYAGHERASEKTSDPEWSGTRNFDEAIKLFQNGWDEKAEEIRKSFTKFENAHAQNVSYEKARPTTSPIGFAPHVPNAIRGLPNSMIYTERTPMKAKVVRIVYSLVMNAGTSASDIMNAGLTVLKLCYSLERKGLRVRIDVAPKFSECGSQNAVCLVCVKDWRQPIDIKKVAFPIAHPSMFRRLGFCWFETTPGLTDTSVRRGYGRALEDPVRSKELLVKQGAMTENDYFVDVTLARNNHFDLKEVAAALGIKEI